MKKYPLAACAALALGSANVAVAHADDQPQNCGKSQRNLRRNVKGTPCMALLPQNTRDCVTSRLRMLDNAIRGQAVSARRATARMCERSCSKRDQAPRRALQFFFRETFKPAPQALHAQDPETFCETSFRVCSD